MKAPHDIRLLLSDVDGTLVTKEKVLTEAARAAVRELNEAGIAFAVTSSRPAIGLRMLVEPLNLSLPIAGFNGGVLARPDMSVIETLPIDPAASRKVVDFLMKQGLDVWVYTEADWYVSDPKGAHVEREAWILKFDAKVAATFDDRLLSRAIKIVGVSDNHALVAASEAAAEELLGSTASATRSADYFLDVTHPHATKGFVVGRMAKQLGISPQQVATIGDMPNDVLMFRQSGFSIAMGNASDAVKAQASAVTDSNEDDGFAKAVRRFLTAPAAA